MSGHPKEQLGIGVPPVHGELEGIQYVRGAAALMVVFDHVSSMMAEPKYFGIHPFSGFFEAGSVGVDLFFCLSGFIIVYIALSAELLPKLKPWPFFKRRFARIVPFMWLIVIVYAALRFSARGGYFPFWSYVRGFTLWPVGAVEPTPVWTLRHEWLFYSVFALTFLSGRRWLFVLWVLSPVAMLFLLPSLPAGAGFWLQLAAFLFNKIDLLFGLGVIVGILYVRRGRTVPTQSWAPPVLALALAVVFLTAHTLAYDRSSILQVLLIGVMSCICLWLACNVPASQSIAGRIGKTLGDASYCIYLTHEIFVSSLLGLFAHHFHKLPHAAVMGTTVAVCIVGGVIVNKLVEDPVVSMSKTLVLGRPVRRPILLQPENPI